jgi:hypothetical protein
VIFWEKGWVLLLKGDLRFLKSASDPENTGVVDKRGEELHMRLEWEGAGAVLKFLGEFFSLDDLDNQI